jgi:uncharacterized protein (TIGR03086 family)
MSHLELLDLAGQRFVDVMTHVDDEWNQPTPCDEWDVGQLVDHVIGGNWFTIEVLGGASARDAMAAAKGGFAAMTDRHLALTESITAQAAAFRRPGALTRICHHVAGDLPGSVVLGFRLTDVTVHGWDLARAIGADDTIPPPLVNAVWADVSATADQVAASGLFGDGPSRHLPAGADLQTRLLDATGRRI